MGKNPKSKMAAAVILISLRCLLCACLLA